MKKILIAVDESPIAAHAAEVGVDLARTLSGEVAFVHAVDPGLVATGETGVPSATMLAVLERDARELLTSYRQRVSFSPAALDFLRMGKPGSEIVKTAAEWPADIVVIGTHGRGGVSHLLLGSVAEGVVRHAPCPVLVVRPHS